MQAKHLLLILPALLLMTSTVCADTDPPGYTLEQAIDASLAYNPELNIMQARIDRADAQLDEALSSFYPQIKTSLSYIHTNNPALAFAMIISQRQLDLSAPADSFNHPGGVDNYRPQVSATYSLFRGGRDYYHKQAAELGVETAELEKSATRNHLINNVTAAFYGYLAAQDAYQLSRRSIESVQSELHQSRVRYDAGTVLKSDVLSLEVQLAEAQDAEIRAQNAIEIAKE